MFYSFDKRQQNSIENHHETHCICSPRRSTSIPQKPPSPFKAESFAFDGLYYSTEHNLALLLTGEGVQSATEKLASVCGAKYNKIKEIINLGVAGILEDSPHLPWGYQGDKNNLSQPGQKMEFKSFSTGSQTSPFDLCDIVTSSQRPQKTDCERLLPFAPLVDREGWAIGSGGQQIPNPLSIDKAFIG